MPWRLPEFYKLKWQLDWGRSTDRSLALFELLTLARKDASIHKKALPIFLEFANTNTNTALLAHSIRGIGVILGWPEEKRRWLGLLDHPDERMIETALRGLGDSRDPAMVGTIAKFLAHPALDIRQRAVTELGRLRVPESMPSLTKCLEDPKLRPYAVQAFGILGDPRAIPLLLPYLDDKTEAWPVDNHGPMMWVGEVVQETLERINSRK